MSGQHTARSQTCHYDVSPKASTNGRCPSQSTSLHCHTDQLRFNGTPSKWGYFSVSTTRFGQRVGIPRVGVTKTLSTRTGSPPPTGDKCTETAFQFLTSFCDSVLKLKLVTFPGSWSVLARDSDIKVFVDPLSSRALLPIYHSLSQAP